MKNLNNFQVVNKRVLLRADLNVPLVDGVITDISRIEVLKSTIKKLLKGKNKIFLLSHSQVIGDFRQSDLKKL